MIGVDLVDISRIARILGEKHGQSFLDKMFTKNELFALKKIRPRQMPMVVSALFAAKEAVVKASRKPLSVASFGQIEVEQVGAGQLVASVAKGERYIISTCVMGEQVIAVASSSGNQEQSETSET